MSNDRWAETRLSIDDLHRWFTLDGRTGTLYHRRTGRRVDKVYPDNGPAYAHARYKQVKVPVGRGFTKVYAHRLIWALYHNRWPLAGMDIDHLNADVHDNRPENLAEVTEAENERRRRAKRFVFLLQANP
ncbi:MAG: HNH endonuclease signature motif containing protein [Alphaproteobacteria bacterium]